MLWAVKRIADVLNDRPLSEQESSNQYPDIDLLSTITPKMLITGHYRSRAQVERVINFDELSQDSLTFVEDLELE